MQRNAVKEREREKVNEEGGMAANRWRNVKQRKRKEKGKRKIVDQQEKLEVKRKAIDKERARDSIDVDQWLVKNGRNLCGRKSL